MYETTSKARHTPRRSGPPLAAITRACALTRLATELGGDTACDPISFKQFDQGRGAHSEAPPPIIAPLDEGTDAPALAQRILAGSLALSEVLLRAEVDGVESSWRGSFVALTRDGRCLRMRSHSASVELDLNSIIAVSHCASRTASGICLYGEAGVLLTLWSKDIRAFDVLLADALRDCGQEIWPVGAT